ncbi:hypothetical protein [Chromobacterium violaceum]|uniref:hypothetical protein n=1 Tax=Chromobacterium violaceum TaxID=536 RepID=UPI000AF9B5DF|nr:hypothetical protein [Chromobacterium violaceum]MBP4047182.1 hypothetical protein [Chromobacterium violaceum]
MQKVWIGVMVMIVSIALQGGVVARGGLIAEILNSASPERFKPIDVSVIVLRYINLGVEKRVAMHELKKQGFEVKEMEQKLEGCVDCESRVVLGGFTKRAAISVLPYESFISIGIGFKKGKVAFVSAWYTKNVY